MQSGAPRSPESEPAGLQRGGPAALGLRPEPHPACLLGTAELNTERKKCTCPEVSCWNPAAPPRPCSTPAGRHTEAATHAQEEANCSARLRTEPSLALQAIGPASSTIRHRRELPTKSRPCATHTSFLDGCVATLITGHKHFHLCLGFMGNARRSGPTPISFFPFFKSSPEDIFFIDF